MAVANIGQGGAAGSAPWPVRGDRPVSVAEGATENAGGEAWLWGGAALLPVGPIRVVRGPLIYEDHVRWPYARNLTTDPAPGLIAGEPSNVATSPMNVLLLVGAAALLRLRASTRSRTWRWRWHGGGGATAATAREGPRLALVLLNSFVLSAIGLEGLLIPPVLVRTLTAASGRQVLPGVLASLAVLRRVDLAVFLFPLSLANLATH